MSVVLEREWTDGGDGMDRWPFETDPPAAERAGTSAHALATEARTDSTTTAAPGTEARTIYVYIDEHGRRMERDEPLPLPPTCMFCGEPGPHLIRMPWGSSHDGSWICPDCQDQAIDTLQAKHKEIARIQRTRVIHKSYRVIQDEDAKGGE